MNINPAFKIFIFASRISQLFSFICHEFPYVKYITYVKDLLSIFLFLEWYNAGEASIGLFWCFFMPFLYNGVYYRPTEFWACISASVFILILRVFFWGFQKRTCFIFPNKTSQLESCSFLRAETSQWRLLLAWKCFFVICFFWPKRLFFIYFF